MMMMMKDETRAPLESSLYFVANVLNKAVGKSETTRKHGHAKALSPLTKINQVF